MINFIIIVVAGLILVGGGYILGINRNRAAAHAELDKLEENVKKFAQKEWGVISLWIAAQREKLGKK